LGTARLGVLVSGTGTIFAAIADAGLPIALVVADRPCAALDAAASRGLATELLDRRRFGGFTKAFDRDGYTTALTALLRRHDIDLVAMAGFGTITSPSIFDAYAGRILNTHPSLLPQFRGWHAVKEAIESRATVTGCTVHVATAELDEGPILAQRPVTVSADDTEASLHERIKEIERVLYPAVIAAVLAGLAEGTEPSARPLELQERGD
jgi:phosphoribosylglycinamide formyltransferase 1